MEPRAWAPSLFSVILAVAVTASCGSDESSIGCAAAQADYNPTIDPAHFPSLTVIDNSFRPWIVGTVYRAKDGDNNDIEITVTGDTKVILGVTCVVVHDKQTAPTGELMEDTYDWYAEDQDGNVWYFGEDTKAYEANGKFSTEGSWVAGVDCAKPGIVMEANPMVGDTYRQEYRAGVAEDQSDILSRDVTITVPYGTFQHCIVTRDYSALEPDADEHKTFCPGVGEVRAEDVVRGGGVGPREDLVSVSGVITEDAGSGTDAGPRDASADGSGG